MPGTSRWIPPVAVLSSSIRLTVTASTIATLASSTRRNLSPIAALEPRQRALARRQSDSHFPRSSAEWISVPTLRSAAALGLAMSTRTFSERAMGNGDPRDPQQEAYGSPLSGKAKRRQWLSKVEISARKSWTFSLLLMLLLNHIDWLSYSILFTFPFGSHIQLPIRVYKDHDTGEHIHRTKLPFGFTSRARPMDRLLDCTRRHAHSTWRICRGWLDRFGMRKLEKVSDSLSKELSHLKHLHLERLPPPEQLQLDGFIARHFKSQTYFGSLIDPVADKTLMTVLTVSLASVDLLPCMCNCPVS